MPPNRPVPPPPPLPDDGEYLRPEWLGRLLHYSPLKTLIAYFFIGLALVTVGAVALFIVMSADSDDLLITVILLGTVGIVIGCIWAVDYVRANRGR